VPYARYRAARSEFDQSGASALLPPLEERDLATVRDAHRSLRTLLSDFPDSAHGVELAYMLEVVTGLLARHELYVARFYLGRGNFQAAVERCRFALATYPGSGLDAEALVLLGETYLRLHEWDRARNTFQLVLDRHPESAFVVPAGRFLARLREGKS